MLQCNVEVLLDEREGQAQCWAVAVSRTEQGNRAHTADCSAPLLPKDVRIVTWRLSRAYIFCLFLKSSWKVKIRFPFSLSSIGDIGDIRAYPYTPCRLLLCLPETEAAFERGETAWQEGLLLSLEGQRCL